MTWIMKPTVRSLGCNGEMLRYYRQRIGCSQQELANRAGYTKRLVAKAESGGSLTPETIEVLAESLSSDAAVVYPEDLTSSPKELTAALLRAITTFEGEAISHCRHILSEELEVYFPGGPAAAPLAGVHRGIDAYDELMHNFFEVFERPDKEIAQRTAVITSEGNRVVLSCFEALSNEYVPPNSPPGPLSLFLLFSRGRIATIQYLFDTMVFGQVVSAWREKHADKISMKHVNNMVPWTDK